MIEIPLTQGKFAMVDDEDFQFLNQWKWFARKHRNTFYANRHSCKNGKNSQIQMHRVILGITQPSIHGDHIDRNGLNNTRKNLREATNSQNQMNKLGFSSCGFRGVSWHKGMNKYQARIGVNKKSIYLGSFDMAEEAADVYNKNAIIHYGEFALLNNI